MRRSRHVVAAFMAAGCLATGAAQAQTGDEIVANNLKAKGGIEALKSTSSVRMTGKISTPQGEMVMMTIAKRPNLVRRELMIAGQKAITAFDGTTVWMQQNTGPAQEVTGPTADRAKSEAEFDSIFVDYGQKGHTVEYVGKETFNGRPVYHLKVVRKGGQVQQYFMDADTGLEAKISTEVTTDMGQKGVVETELSDYRNVDGRMVPFKLRQLINGTQAAQITFDKIEFNAPLDDSIFKMPGAR